MTERFMKKLKRNSTILFLFKVKLNLMQIVIVILILISHEILYEIQ